MKSDARDKINKLLRRGDLAAILEKTGHLHGHFCPGSALGVKAGYVAMKRLGVVENPGMEELLAVIETNNCFADGVQMTTGCTFGNNALIYADLGKTAFTLMRRGSPRGVRVAVRPKSERTDDDDPLVREARELFDKVVKRREGTDEERDRLAVLWKKRSFMVLEQDEEKLFRITDVTQEPPPYAPIFDSQICSKCGEEVMETRCVLVRGKPTCLACAGVEYRMVAGKGILTMPARVNR